MTKDWCPGLIKKELNNLKKCSKVGKKVWIDTSESKIHDTCEWAKKHAEIARHHESSGNKLNPHETTTYPPQ